MKHLLLPLILLAAPSVAGQSHDRHQAPAAAAAQAGVRTPDRAAGLRNGEGLGFAIPAERNGYPGPLHVLDLADALHLTADQRRATDEVRQGMRREAIEHGERLLRLEEQLESLFRTGRADERSIRRVTAAIGEAEARLKAVHLLAHSRMMAILSLEQVALYRQLRNGSGGVAPAGR